MRTEDVNRLIEQAIQGHASTREREWIGLTDQEIWDISVDNQQKGGGFWGYPRALEAKLKEKNSP